MKSFEITVDNMHYTVSPCTAIPEFADEDENERQDALLVICQPEKTEINGLGEEILVGPDLNAGSFDSVVFGWTMPKSREEFLEMAEDTQAWEDTALACVIKRSMTPPHKGIKFCGGV